MVTHKAVVLNLCKSYRKGMRAKALYEATRGFWITGKDREKAEYAIAVFHGVAKEVYRIHEWHPVGTLKYETRETAEWVSDDRRWEFEGEVAEESVRGLYVGREIHIDGKPVKGSQSSVRYANIKNKGARG